MSHQDRAPLDVMRKQGLLDEEDQKPLRPHRYTGPVSRDRERILDEVAAWLREDDRVRCSECVYRGGEVRGLRFCSADREACFTDDRPHRCLLVKRISSLRAEPPR